MKTQDPVKCPECDGPLPILYSVSILGTVAIDGEFKRNTIHDMTLEHMLDHIEMLNTAYNNNEYQYFNRPIFIHSKLGQCAFCNKLASIVELQEQVSIAPIETLAPVWNWEQFYIAESNDELSVHSQSTDDELQTRIESLRELDRQTELTRQSIRIRIQVDSGELVSRGKKVRKSRSIIDASYIPVIPTTGLPRISASRSKMDKTKDALSALGIDFDKFMLSLSNLPDIPEKK